MSRRSDEDNRRIYSQKISRLYFKEEFDIGDKPKPPPRNPFKWLLAALPIAVFCTAVVLAMVVAMQDSQSQRPTVESLKTEAFRWAVNRAMNAAELTQTAASKDEWSTVSTWWKEAIDLMQSVPKSHPKYSLAQQKIQEYQQKLVYAQSRTDSRTELVLPSVGMWSIGSRRIDVLKIQGNPTHEARYDALCQEVMYYGNSMVEFSNGVVVKYDDLDKNLKAAPEDAAMVKASDAYVWTLGSSREDVFGVQGTPDRVTRYDSLHKETLYYNNSLIELTENFVTGYSNLDGTLRVAIASIETVGSNDSWDSWTIGSDRNNVFRVQGTPTQVTLDHSSCRETLNYGESTIELKNGFVDGYDNLGRNLRVKVK